jgi:glycosyltransferase involved in cell wall biosynthesis
MKILLVNTGVFPIPPERGGGTEQYVYYLANYLANLGHEVHLVSDVVKGCYFHKNMIIIEVHAPPAKFKMGFCGLMLSQTLGGLSVFKTAFPRLISRNPTFDVIHTHGRLGALLLSALKLKIPFVYTLHDSSPWSSFCKSSVEEFGRKVAYSNLEMRTCKNADHIVVVSQVIKNELISRLKIDEKKISFIPSGVDTRIFKRPAKEASEEDIREKYCIPGKYCIFVGQLLPRKGVDLLVKAFKNMEADVRCVIVGEGPERTKLSKFINDLSLQDKVKLVGAVPLADLVKLYASASFFVLPSLSEGLPLVILEATACGLPVIAFKVGGIPDVIKNGYNGFLAQPKDIDQIHDMIELLSDDEELRKKMANQAYKFTKENFSWDKTAEKHVKIYKNLLNTTH